VIGEVVLRTRPLSMCERWYAGDVADPFELVRRTFRPTSVLWDGTTTWMLLEGHPDDVDAQGRACGLSEVDPSSLPPLPPHRWSLPPAALADLPNDHLGAFVAEVGVGVVHRAAPQPARDVAPPIADLQRRIKEAFDPTGRFAPGRTP